MGEAGGAAAWAEPTQNFSWVGHNAFGPTNNWPVRLLILGKTSKLGATRCQILRLKCTNSLSQIHLQRSPTPNCIQGPISKGR